MSGRLGFRHFAQSSRQSAFRSSTNSFKNSRQTFFRRGQTTTAGEAAAEAPKESFWQRLWTSEVGIRTVHFWAPIMKWGVVLVGASDFFRPAEKLSITQNLALMATGSIWTRWCFVIRPKNMLLAAVNFALGIVGTVQVGRIFSYNLNLTGSVSAALSRMGNEIAGNTKQADQKLKQDVEQAVVVTKAEHELKAEAKAGAQAKA